MENGEDDIKTLPSSFLKMQALADSLFGVFSSSGEIASSSNNRDRSSSRGRTRRSTTSQRRRSAPRRSDSRRSASRRSASRRRSSDGRTIINVELKPGGLSDWGYDSDSSATSRHRALMRAARGEGYRPIIGRLNLLYVYNRYRSPHYAKIFKMDQKWLSKKYEQAKVPRSRSF